MESRGLNILLIEDDEDDYLIIRNLLAEAGGTRFDLDWVSTYDSALETMSRNSHDVCLLDFRLAGRTGLELLHEAITIGFKSPIIFLTGQADHDLDVEVMKAGAADYLVKGQIGASLLERSLRYAVERGQVLEALRQSEERYALAARGANDGLWDWDLKNNMVFYSTRWKAMLGVDESTEISSTDDWFRRVHPLDQERLKAEIAAHLEGLTPHFQTEHRMMHTDGTYRWILSRGMAVRDADGTAQRMAGSQTDITNRKAAEEQLLHDAFHDPLTGLSNRALFIDRLTRAVWRTKRGGKYSFAVLFFDLDCFKLINDSLGHATGDHLLIAIGRRMEACLRGGDTIARLGGDEFTILLDDIQDAGDAIRLADRIQNELKIPFKLNNQDVYTSASIGIALSSSGYDQPDDLLRDADTAMYQAKRMGKACHAMFDIAMHSKAVARFKLDVELRRAMERQEFRLHYQPIVALETNEIECFEALVRWQHPERGLVFPEEFIPVAEETGLITNLGIWVLREACRQTMRWRLQHPRYRRLTVSVNLSMKQLTQADLIEQIDHVLQETGLEAHCLHLEITESVIMEHPDSAAHVLKRIESMGIRLSLDDFGTGYSSLSYLHRFPISTLKIDRSFVSRMDSDGDAPKVVRTIVTLANDLKMQVVAEGVETESQLAQVKALGCRYGQGYVFSRPIEGVAAGALLLEYSGGARRSTTHPPHYNIASKIFRNSHKK